MRLARPQRHPQEQVGAIASSPTGVRWSPRRAEARVAFRLFRDNARLATPHSDGSEALKSVQDPTDNPAVQRFVSGLAVCFAALSVAVVPAALSARSSANAWSGTWDTSWSGGSTTMTLIQSGSSVSGTYTWDSGKIQGTLNGNVLTGTWTEVPTRQAPHDAGDIEFTLSADGKSWTGKWRYGSSGDWSFWNGACSAGECTKNVGPEASYPSLPNTPLPDALVPIDSVSNGCGGGDASTDPRYGDTSTYLNSNNPFGKRYQVNFREACNLHDAGYSGARVRDSINGGIIDYLGWTQKRVDDKFLADMRKLCEKGIPASAPVALADCKARGGKASFGAETRYNFVRRWGSHFWKDRPRLSGRWLDKADASASWVLGQQTRTITAAWSSNNGQLKGRFRGTLISRDNDSIIKGTMAISDGGTTVTGTMTFTIQADNLDQLSMASDQPNGATGSATLVRP